MKGWNERALHGRLIVIEGIDGAGKDFVACNLKEHLSVLFPALADSIVTTTEPTLISPASNEIEQFLQNTHNQPLTSEQAQTLAKLYIKDRHFHQKTLKTYQEQGKLILCVRYDLSTYAYQGAVLNQADRTALFQQFYTLHAYNQPHGSLIPDLTYFLDISIETSKKRIDQRARALHFYEKQQTSFTQNVIQSYKDAILFLEKKDQRNVIIVNATASIETLLPQLERHLALLR